MKKIYIFLLISFILIIFLLTLYIVTIARTPIVSKLIKFDKDSITYKVTNISPVKYYYGMGDILQYKENNHWVNVKPKKEFVVQAVMLCLTEFGRGKDEIKINLKEEYGELKSGEYRIEKIFDREEERKNYMEYKLYIYFDI